MRLPRSYADLARLLISAADTGTGATVAARLVALADQAPSDGDVTRAEILVAASDAYAIAGDAARRIELARTARADGGRTVRPTSIVLAAALLASDDGERTEAEAVELLRQFWRDRPRDPDLCMQAGELLEPIDDVAALRWFNRGIEMCDAEDGNDDAVLEQLLIARLEVRHTMGLPADEYDELA